MGSLTKEMMRKVVRGRSKGGKYRGKESLLENFIENIKGEEITEHITMKGKSEVECYKWKGSQSSKGVPFGKGQVDTLQKEDNKNINTPMKRKMGKDGGTVHAYLLALQKKFI